MYRLSVYRQLMVLAASVSLLLLPWFHIITGTLWTVEATIALIFSLLVLAVGLGERPPAVGD